MRFDNHCEVGVVILRHVFLIFAQLNCDNTSKMWAWVIPKITQNQFIMMFWPKQLLQVLLVKYKITFTNAKMQWFYRAGATDKISLTFREMRMNVSINNSGMFGQLFI